MNFSSETVFRIIFEGRENYRVMDNRGNIFKAELAGVLRIQATLWPAIGDWIVGHLQAGDWVLIEEIINRKSCLARKDPGQSRVQILAANVDTLFIVTSANHDLNFNRLDRYVALATAGGVSPVIIINKIELSLNPHELLDQVSERFPDIDIHGVSVYEGWNLDSLNKYVTCGQTVAFVGSSGVGKSTLTNALLNREEAQTQEIRGHDGRGRHTTAHRELHVTLGGAMVIDTPGLRVVGLVDDSGLDTIFSDIESLALQCKFTNCRHRTEPGCAIRRELESGALDASKWRNYLKLQKERAFEVRKSSKALRSVERQKWAKIHMDNRARQRRSR